MTWMTICFTVRRKLRQNRTQKTRKNLNLKLLLRVLSRLRQTVVKMLARLPRKTNQTNKAMMRTSIWTTWMRRVRWTLKKKNLNQRTYLNHRKKRDPLRSSRIQTKKILTMKMTNLQMTAMIQRKRILKRLWQRLHKRSHLLNSPKSKTRLNHNTHKSLNNNSHNNKNLNSLSKTNPSSQTSYSTGHNSSNSSNRSQTNPINSKSHSSSKSPNSSNSSKANPSKTIRRKTRRTKRTSTENV
jgi:hypothetical protein